jgi:SAM-dependent methyltransferase
LYHELLGRPIDPDGLTAFRNALAHGTTRADVVLALATSNEYQARCRDRLSISVSNSPRSRRPDRYHFDDVLSIWVFTAESNSDFDWLEQAILGDGFYDKVMWTLEVDADKRTMAEIISLLCIGRVLEIGCSSGAVLQELQDRGVSVEGIDISAVALEHASERVRNHIHYGDLLTLKLSNDFDTVVGLDIFEHLNPNRLEAYLDRLRTCLLPGGLLFAVIPAYGNDTVFGEILPYYISSWYSDAAAGQSFRALHVDSEGYPMNGHLIWADTSWWLDTFAAAGFVRRPAVEIALHEKYDDYLRVNAPFRRLFYVFSVGDCPLETMIVERIQSSTSSIVAGWTATMS